MNSRIEDHVEQLSSRLDASSTPGTGPSSPPPHLSITQRLLGTPTNTRLPTAGTINRDTPDPSLARASTPYSQSRGPNYGEDLGISIKAYVKQTGATLKAFASSQKSSHQRAHSESTSSRPTVSVPTSDPLKSAPPTKHRYPGPDLPVTRSSPLTPKSPKSSPLPEVMEVLEGADGILPLPDGAMEEQYELIDEVKVPALLAQGTPMAKISAAKGRRVHTFKLDAEQGQMTWNSRKGGTVGIENIKEIRTGVNARNYREQLKVADDSESRWMTVIYTRQGKYKTLHVVAPTVDLFNLWHATLSSLWALRKELAEGAGDVERRELIWEKQYWKSTDSSGDARLTFDEVQKMCNKLNLYPAKDDLKAKFKDADADGDGYLDFTQFQKFVRLLKARPDIERLFQEYAPDGQMEFFGFENFMRQTQKSTLPQEVLQAVFDKHCDSTSSSTRAASEQKLAEAQQQMASLQITQSEPNALTTSGAASRPQSMTLTAFSSFLLSTENAPFPESLGKIHQDMTRPISEYFISSSHNTYLIGNQLVGSSTTEGYIRALLQGCRSVELDIWDGEKEPCVYHGKTLTSSVSVREISKAIARYAFIASPYPIIISAEIHCKVEQQDMVAQIMREEFGNALVTGPLPGREHEETEGVAVLPSPEELKGKILLKAKKLFVAENVPLEEKQVTVDADSSATETSTSESSEVEKEGSSLVPRARGLLHKVREKGHGLLHRSRSRHSNNGTPQEAPPKSKISLELAALLIYTVGVKCRGINKKETYDPVHLFSLSESTANKIMKTNMLDIIKHNRTHVIRIYPKGLRLKSSNYEPHKYWAAGAHLVAINWQTHDLGYMINYAMFQRNGRCGFVLKPDPLRIKENKESLNTRTRHYLDVTIVSAQQLPRRKEERAIDLIRNRIPDPYVEVSVHVPEWTATPFLESDQNDIGYSKATSSTKPDATASSARATSARTKIIKNNGFNPVWEEDLSIPFDLAGDMKDLVFVKFEVKDRGETEDHHLGVYIAPLGSLNTGYRHLPLSDQQMSQYLFSTLFVKIGVRNVA